MNLNSPFFLFLFLPVTIILYLVAGSKLRNGILAVASLFFLIWGEPLYFPLILCLVLIDFCLALDIQARRDKEKATRGTLIVSVIINIVFLLGFKIISTYRTELTRLIEQVFHYSIPTGINIYLARFIYIPLGLSFLSFQAISYVMDVAKGTIIAKKNILQYFVYMLMFPRMISGPIVRYGEISNEIKERQLTFSSAADGARRFIRGMAKKTLIADQLALVDSGVFGNPSGLLPTPIAWLTILCFTLRIYYDLSGYTDMALGLGQILGFQLPENFNFPYIAKSLSEFWRRWHMTLSRWFRDYIFYPLERKRKQRAGNFQASNILVVFLLTGLWHGVTINFIAWGLLQGIIISMESSGVGEWLKKRWAPIQHGYFLVMIILSWLLFASPSLTFTLQFLKSLLGLQGMVNPLPYAVFPPVQPLTWIALVMGILFATPLFAKMREILFSKHEKSKFILQICGDVVIIGLFMFSIIVLTGTTFQAYIYGKF